MTRPVAVSQGDPAGIGPEIIMKALARPDVHALCNPLVVGDAAAGGAGASLAVVIGIRRLLGKLSGSSREGRSNVRVIRTGQR